MSGERQCTWCSRPIPGGWEIDCCSLTCARDENAHLRAQVEALAGERVLEAATEAVLKLNAPRLEAGLSLRNTKFMARKIARTALAAARDAGSAHDQG